MTTTYTWIEDPGHSWLKVPATTITALGLQGHFSQFSYIDRPTVFDRADQHYYLEEDCDAAIFLVAHLEQRGEPAKVRDHHIPHGRSFDRSGLIQLTRGSYFQVALKKVSEFHRRDTRPALVKYA